MRRGDFAAISSIAMLLLAALVSVPALAHDMAGMHAHHFGAAMMPFDLSRSRHIFTPLADGGTQDVVSLDRDPHQIVLIRGHLKTQAMMRKKGDYSTPAAMHGANMPGLAALAEGSARLRVSFVKLPNGGRIRYATRDPALVRAVHLWFKAQVHDHGPDAVMSHG